MFIIFNITIMTRYVNEKRVLFTVYTEINIANKLY